MTLHIDVIPDIGEDLILHWMILYFYNPSTKSQIEHISSQNITITNNHK